jgi:hypothetical protein
MERNRRNFNADFESFYRSFRRKITLRWSRDQCSAEREKRFCFLVGLGYDSRYRLELGFGLKFRCEIRTQLQGL